jgi:hypothetical protein
MIRRPKQIMDCRLAPSISLVSGVRVAAATFSSGSELINARGWGDFANPIVLFRAPYPVAFSYAGPDHVWRETWRGKAQLPRTIRVEVRGAAGAPAVSTSTFIRAELPARCALATTPLDECLGTKTPANSGANSPAPRQGL